MNTINQKKKNQGLLQAKINSSVEKKLESFNFDKVKLNKGPLQAQYQDTHDFYSNLSNDSLLYGFRERAGLKAQGESLGGWYENDIFNN